MRRLIPIIGVVLALALPSSCGREAEPESPQRIKMTFTASMADASPSSRTQVVDGQHVWWSPSDAVSIFYGSGINGGSRFVTTNQEPAATVDFTGELERMSGGVPDGKRDFWAVYPFESDNECDGESVTLTVPGYQFATPGSFEPYSFPSVAKSKTTELRFYNVCGGVVLQFSDPNFDSVIISGNNGEYIAGKVRVAFDEDGHPYVQEVLEGLKEVKLDNMGQGFDTTRSYYIAMLPGALSKGITIFLCRGNQAGLKCSAAPQQVKRSVFGRLRDLEEVVTYGPYPVDLGLSVRWASCNVGAIAPEYYGTYFAWADPREKESFFWSSYLWYSGVYMLTKYNTDSDNGKVDGKLLMEPEDDPASVAFTTYWRTPTVEEIKELRTKCTWTWADHQGITGYEVSGNGNTIFIPAAGYMNGKTLYRDGLEGGFWASSVNPSSTTSAQALSFTESSLTYRQSYDRPYGLPVRAVCK